MRPSYRENAVQPLLGLQRECTPLRGRSGARVGQKPGSAQGERQSGAALFKKSAPTATTHRTRTRSPTATHIPQNTHPEFSASPSRISASTLSPYPVFLFPRLPSSVPAPVSALGTTQPDLGSASQTLVFFLHLSQAQLVRLIFVPFAPLPLSPTSFLAMSVPSLIGRPSLLSNGSNTRRREPSHPSATATRGSSTLASSGTGAWGAAAPTSQSEPHLSGGARKKGAPSLSFAGTHAELQGRGQTGAESIHPLKSNWDVWFSHRSAIKPKPSRDDDKRDTPVKTAGVKDKVELEDWEHGLTNLGGFSSIESLHPFLAHLTTPSAFPASLHSSATLFNPDGAEAGAAEAPAPSNYTSEINVFRSPIQPSWEHSSNVGGGRWVLRLRKGVADRIWEEVVFALVGERLGGGPQAEEGSPEARAGDKINGVVISVRKDEDILGLWCAPSTRPERDAIRDSLRAALEPLLGQAGAANLQLDYKPHPSSNAPGGAGQGGPHTPGGGAHFGSNGHSHSNGHHHRRNHNGATGEREPRTPGGAGLAGQTAGDRSADQDRQPTSRRVAGFGNYSSPRSAAARDSSRDGLGGTPTGPGEEPLRSSAFGERRAGQSEGRPRRGSGGERELTQRSSATAWGRS